MTGARSTGRNPPTAPHRPREGAALWPPLAPASLAGFRHVGGSDAWCSRHRLPYTTLVIVFSTSTVSWPLLHSGAAPGRAALARLRVQERHATVRKIRRGDVALRLDDLVVKQPLQRRRPLAGLGRVRSRLLYRKWRAARHRRSPRGCTGPGAGAPHTHPHFANWSRKTVLKRAGLHGYSRRRASQHDAVRGVVGRAGASCGSRAPPAAGAGEPDLDLPVTIVRSHSYGRYATATIESVIAARTGAASASAKR